MQNSILCFSLHWTSKGLTFKNKCTWPELKIIKCLNYINRHFDVLLMLLGWTIFFVSHANISSMGRREKLPSRCSGPLLFGSLVWKCYQPLQQQDGGVKPKKRQVQSKLSRVRHEMLQRKENIQYATTNPKRRTFRKQLTLQEQWFQDAILPILYVLLEGAHAYVEREYSKVPQDMPSPEPKLKPGGERVTRLNE